jgi:hypothetical protein
MAEKQASGVYPCPPHRHDDSKNRRTDLARLEPAGDAMEVKRVVANTPSDGALLRANIRQFPATNTHRRNANDTKASTNLVALRSAIVCLARDALTCDVIAAWRKNTRRVG